MFMQCCHLTVTQMKNVNEMIKKAIKSKENGLQQLKKFFEFLSFIMNKPDLLSILFLIIIIIIILLLL